MKAKFLFIFMMLCAFPVMASEYEIDYTQSSVKFSGTHAGNVFEGEFSDWNGEIVFDADDLESSRIVARFDLRSAKTGNLQYDGTLPNSDWFNVKKTPEGVFESKAIVENGKGGYTAQGDLTLRGITKPASFDFTLSDLDTQPVMAKGRLIVNRLSYDIGKKSDPEAEWVSRDITVTFDVTASVAE